MQHSFSQTCNGIHALLLGSMYMRIWSAENSQKLLPQVKNSHCQHIRGHVCRHRGPLRTTFGTFLAKILTKMANLTKSCLTAVYGDFKVCRLLEYKIDVTQGSQIHKNIFIRFIKQQCFFSSYKHTLTYIYKYQNIGGNTAGK